MYLTLETSIPGVDAYVFTLNLQARLGRLSFDDEVVVAVRAVFVALLELLGVLAEALLALFAGKSHFGALHEVVLLRLGMALGAVEPLAAAGAADGDLSVEDVFT